MACLFHKWELVGLTYEEFSPKFNNYGLRTYKIERCKKCRKRKMKQLDKYLNTYSLIRDDTIQRLKDEGFISINEYRKVEIANNLKG
ncbi:MAG: hypothetical protein ACRCX2_19410 [Paraclostridium sp.]